MQVQVQFVDQNHSWRLSECVISQMRIQGYRPSYQITDESEQDPLPIT